MAFIDNSRLYLMKIFFTKLSILLLACSFILSCSERKEWKLLNTVKSSHERHECGFVEHKDNLYLIGGRGIKPVDKFVIKENNWIALKNTPIEMNHITPVSYGEEIYIVTGLTGNYPIEEPLSHIYTFNLKNQSWKKVIEIPVDRRRGGAGVTVYKEKIYIVNGITNGHTSGTSAMFDVYDPKNNTWEILPDAPNIRDHSAAVVVDHILIALGGRNTSYHENNNFEAFFAKVIDEVDYFNFETNTWNTYASKLPNPAAGGGAVQLNNMIYFMGGETGKTEASKQLYAFDTKTEKWTKKPSLNIGRHGTNAVTHNNKIYIASGSGNRGGGPELNSIEVYTSD